MKVRLIQPRSNAFTFFCGNNLFGGILSHLFNFLHLFQSENVNKYLSYIHNDNKWQKFLTYQSTPTSQYIYSLLYRLLSANDLFQNLVPLLCNTHSLFKMQQLHFLIITIIICNTTLTNAHLNHVYLTDKMCLTYMTYTINYMKAIYFIRKLYNCI